MENQDVDAQQTVNALYNLTANLLINEKKSPAEAQNILMEKGLSSDAAYTIVQNIGEQIRKARKERAGKDILFGALWCIGGTIATVANIGFIFWGAILFGGIQLIKGLVNYFGD